MTRLEKLHNYPPFVAALNEMRDGKQSVSFICPVKLLTASPINREIYSDFSEYDKDPNADTKLVRKMHDLIYGKEGLINYAKTDPDGVGNQEPVCIDYRGYIRHGDRRCYGSKKADLEFVRVFICVKEKAYREDRPEDEEIAILADFNLGKQYGRDEDDWYTLVPVFMKLRNALAKKLNLSVKDRKNPRHFTEVRNKFALDRGVQPKHLLDAVKLWDQFGKREAMKWFKLLDNNMPYDGKPLNNPSKALTFANDKSFVELMNDPQFFWKYWNENPKIQEEFKEEYAKLKNAYLANHILVNNVNHNTVLSEEIGKEQGAISTHLSHEGMTAIAAVMLRHGFTCKTASKENDTVYDVEITHYKGKELKGKTDGYHRPTIEVKVSLFKDTQGAANKWGGGSGSGTARCPDATDFLLISRDETCQNFWICLTTINRQDWKSNGSKGKDSKVEGSKIISAKTWYENHYEKGDFCQILGETELESKVNLILEKLQ